VADQSAGTEPGAKAKSGAEAKPSAGIGRSEPLRIAGTVLTIALWVADLLVHHSQVQKVLGFVLIPVLVHVAITDLEERRIKNRVTFPPPSRQY